MSDSALHRWIELAVPAGLEAVEAASEILDRVASGGVAIEEPLEGGTEAFVKAYILDDPAAAGRIAEVRTALGHLQAFGLGPIGELRLREIADEDWLESWKKSFTPIRIGAFRIRPSWTAVPPDDAIALVLDPGMAFGTGLHPTTQQCLRWLGTADVAGKALLDVGCGSGVLAIAAAKRGAARIFAVDIDPLAVEATVENAALNGVGLEVAGGSAADVIGRFDIVVANIVAPVLRAMAPELLARIAPGGTLLLAGIVESSEGEIAGTFVALGLAVVERFQEGDWVSLVLR